MTVVISVFFSIRIKQDWEHAEILDAGNNFLDSARNNNNFLINILNGNFIDVETNLPKNINYGLEVLGSPKSDILVGCPLNCEYLKDILMRSPNYGAVFVNGRWINFTVDSFNINTGIPYYDAVILVNYTNYSNPTIKSYINDYLKNGGVIIGINDTLSSSDSDFNNLYNLSSASGASSTVYFTSYNPSVDDISKYFLGIGMETYSDFYLWEQQWNVDYWGTNSINLTDVSNPSINRTNLVEGSVFGLTGPDANQYFFKVKKLWYPDRVDFQALNKSFVFKDFSEKNVGGNNIVGSGSYAALATNNSVVWLSGFNRGDEYNSLVKAAILSRTDVWLAKFAIGSNKEKTTVSAFESLCCDMPETAELYFTMWYEV
jgi:hypothetical protein